MHQHSSCRRLRCLQPTCIRINFALSSAAEILGHQGEGRPPPSNAMVNRARRGVIVAAALAVGHARPGGLPYCTDAPGGPHTTSFRAASAPAQYAVRLTDAATGSVVTTYTPGASLPATRDRRRCRRAHHTARTRLDLPAQAAPTRLRSPHFLLRLRGSAASSCPHSRARPRTSAHRSPARVASEFSPPSTAPASQ